MEGKTVTILGTQYKIKMDSPLIYEGRPVCGKIDYQDRIIYIDSSMDRAMQEWTLLHEIGHGTWRRSGFYHNVSNEMEELIVDMLYKPVIEQFHLRFRSKKFTLD